LSLVAAAGLLGACATAPIEQIAPVGAGDFASNRINVTVRGDGPDVILIHGMSSHAEVWDTTAAALEGRYRLHIVQMKGFAGFAAEGNAEGPVAAPVAEEISRYIDTTGIVQPAVIGHSMGGAIGMMLAARHPESVGKLLVVDMFPFMGAMFGGPNATPDSVRPIADGIRAQMRMAPQGAISPILEQTINNMVRTTSARPRILGHARDSNVGVTANAFHELIVTDLRPELANIRVPLTAMYVIPPEAPVSPAAYEGFMRASFANAPQTRFVKIDDSYHFIMVDQFDRFMAEVNAFLAQ